MSAKSAKRREKTMATRTTSSAWTEYSARRKRRNRPDANLRPSEELRWLKTRLLDSKSA